MRVNERVCESVCVCVCVCEREREREREKDRSRIGTFSFYQEPKM